MRMLFSAAIAACVLTGCAPMAGPGTPPPAAPLSITYKTGACFGACPVYSVTVDGSGSGTFEGERFTSSAGKQSFALTPAQFDAFAGALARFRPRGEKLVQPGTPACGMAATDMPGVDIVWREGGRTDHLNVYFGCDMEKNRAMFDALRVAPNALAIQGLIGAHS